MGSSVVIVRLLALGLAAACPGLAAAEPPASAEHEALAPGVSPEARAVLDRMTAYLQGLQRFSVTARETRDEVLPYGYKLQRQQHATMVVQRPDKLRVDVDGDIKHRSYFYDGTTLTIHAPSQQVYTQVGAPATIGGMTDALLAEGVEMPLIDVLVQCFRGTLAQDARVGKLVGESEIDGVRVQHLAFRQSRIDWQVWVEAGERPLPRKFLVTTRYEVGEPQSSAMLDWNLEPRIARDTFVFDPPDGTRRIPLAGVADATEPSP